MKLLALVTCLIGSTAAADINISFRDGAPVDTFRFAPTDSCLTAQMELFIDLSGSTAGLIFDITDAGAGVEVFQPFVPVAGGDTLISASDVGDGDTGLTLLLSELTAPFAFTIDLDDTIGQREITVSGAEIAGASVVMTMGDATMAGTFDSTGNAVIKTPDCAT